MKGIQLSVSVLAMVAGVTIAAQEAIEGISTGGGGGVEGGSSSSSSNSGGPPACVLECFTACAESSNADGTDMCDCNKECDVSTCEDATKTGLNQWFDSSCGTITGDCGEDTARICIETLQCGRCLPCLEGSAGTTTEDKLCGSTACLDCLGCKPYAHCFEDDVVAPSQSSSPTTAPPSPTTAPPSPTTAPPSPTTASPSFASPTIAKTDSPSLLAGEMLCSTSDSDSNAPCRPKGAGVDEAYCVYGDHCACKGRYVCSDTGSPGECTLKTGNSVTCVLATASPSSRSPSAAKPTSEPTSTTRTPTSIMTSSPTGMPTSNSGSNGSGGDDSEVGEDATSVIGLSGICTFDPENKHNCKPAIFHKVCPSLRQQDCGNETVNPVQPCCKWASPPATISPTSSGSGSGSNSSSDSEPPPPTCVEDCFYECATRNVDGTTDDMCECTKACDLSTCGNEMKKGLIEWFSNDCEAITGNCSEDTARICMETLECRRCLPCLNGADTNSEGEPCELCEDCESCEPYAHCFMDDTDEEDHTNNVVGDDDDVDEEEADTTTAATLPDSEPEPPIPTGTAAASTSFDRALISGLVIFSSFSCSFNTGTLL